MTMSPRGHLYRNKEMSIYTDVSRTHGKRLAGILVRKALRVSQELAKRNTQ